MSNFLTVYRREFSAYFNSPIAYVVIVAFLLVMSFVFFLFMDFFGSPNPSFRPFFENLFSFGFFSLVFIPALTMRLWAEEKKQGSIELLLTFPMSTSQVVLAKFFACYTVIVVAVLATLSVPISISTVLPLDWGVVFTNYLGILAIGAVIVALGGFTSALTENQMVGFILAVVGSGILTFIGFPRSVEFFNKFNLGDILAEFGTYTHYQNFGKGLVDLVDLIYVVSMTALFLILNSFVVESRKY